MCVYHKTTRFCVSCDRILRVDRKRQTACPKFPSCGNVSIGYQSNVCVQCGCTDSAREEERKESDEETDDDGEGGASIF